MLVEVEVNVHKKENNVMKESIWFDKMWNVWKLISLKVLKSLNLSTYFQINNN